MRRNGRHVRYQAAKSAGGRVGGAVVVVHARDLTHSLIIFGSQDPGSRVHTEDAQSNHGSLFCDLRRSNTDCFASFGGMFELATKYVELRREEAKKRSEEQELARIGGEMYAPRAPHIYVKRGSKHTVYVG